MRARAIGAGLIVAALGCHSKAPSTPMPDLGCAVATGRDPRCPPTPPADGTACDSYNECEYGGDSLARNTTFAYCATAFGATTASWFVVAPWPVTAVGPNPPACPTTYAEAQATGSCATDVNLACDYDEGRCGCVCLGTTVSWQCRDRASVPSDPRGTNSSCCPIVRPRAGDACASEGAFCFYDEVCGESKLSFGPAMRCLQGYWETTVDTGAACITLACPGWTG